jgi:hypothetical protein
MMKSFPQTFEEGKFDCALDFAIPPLLDGAQEQVS